MPSPINDPTPESSGDEELLEIDPEDLILEDDEFLERAAMGLAPAPPTAIPAAGTPPAAPHGLVEDPDLEEDSYLETLAEKSEFLEPLAASPPAHALVPAAGEAEFEEIPRGATTSSSAQVPPSGSTTPSSSPARSRAVSLSREQFIKMLEEKDPSRLLNDIVKPYRLHTSVPAIPIPAGEFPFTGFGTPPSNR